MRDELEGAAVEGELRGGAAVEGELRAAQPSREGAPDLEVKYRRTQL